ncbi:MAG: hypothetical protein RLZZ227_1840 [Pseudomonadota bacterium]
MTGQRLLIIDDDALSAETVSNVATLAGYEVEITLGHREFFSQTRPVPAGYHRPGPGDA